MVDQLGQMPQAVTGTAEAMFEAVDENADGRISPAEYRQLIEAWNGRETDTSEVFTLLDLNRRRIPVAVRVHRALDGILGLRQPGRRRLLYLRRLPGHRCSRSTAYRESFTPRCCGSLAKSESHSHRLTWVVPRVSRMAWETGLGWRGLRLVDVGGGGRSERRPGRRSADRRGAGSGSAGRWFSGY